MKNISFIRNPDKLGFANIEQYVLTDKEACMIAVMMNTLYSVSSRTVFLPLKPGKQTKADNVTKFMAVYGIHKEVLAWELLYYRFLLPVIINDYSIYAIEREHVDPANVEDLYNRFYITEMFKTEPDILTVWAKFVTIYQHFTKMVTIKFPRDIDLLREADRIICSSVTKPSIADLSLLVPDEDAEFTSVEDEEPDSYGFGVEEKYSGDIVITELI